MVNEKGIDIMDKEIQKKVSSGVIDCLDNLSIADQLDVIAVVYASLAKAAYQMFDEDKKGQAKGYFVDQIEKMKSVILSEAE